MRKRLVHKGLSGLMWAGCMLTVLAVAAWPQAESGESSGEEQSKPKPPQILTLDVGVAGPQISGLSAKLREYSSPPTGIYLRELTLQPARFPFNGSGLLTLRGYGSDDIRADLLLAFQGDKTQFSYSADRLRFIGNTPQVVPTSSRRTDELVLRQRIAPGFALTWQYGTLNVNRYFEAPREAERWRGRVWSVRASGNVGQGAIGVAISDTRFYDRMLALPDTSMQQWTAYGVWSPGETADVQGSVTGTSFERSGKGVGRVHEVALAGTSSLGNVGDLTLRGVVEHSRWPEMEGAYVRDRRMAEAGFQTRVGTMGLRLKWQYREAERVRGDSSYLDVPKWTTASGRLSGRIGRFLRLTVRGSMERMWQRPQMVTEDTRSAIWDGRDALSAELATVGEALNGYVSWSYQRRGNTVRGTNVTSGVASAGATWSVAPRLELFGEVAYETWRGRSEVTAYPTLGNFMPDSRVTSLGLSYAVTPRTFFWAGYTDTATNNDNPLLLRDGNTRSQYFTVSLRHRFGAGEELSLSVAPWTYRDTVDSTMNVTATTVVLSAIGRF